MTTEAKHTTDQQRTISETILKQLGGRRFSAMVGMKSAMYGESKGSVFVQIRHMKSAIKTTYFTVRLNTNDTYDLEFFTIRKFEVVMKEKLSDIHAEDLQKTFTSITGLNTHL